MTVAPNTKLKVIQSSDEVLFAKAVQGFISECVEEQSDQFEGVTFLRPVRDVSDVQYGIVQSATSRYPLYTALISYTGKD